MYFNPKKIIKYYNYSLKNILNEYEEGQLRYFSNEKFNQLIQNTNIKQLKTGSSISFLSQQGRASLSFPGGNVPISSQIKKYIRNKYVNGEIFLEEELGSVDIDCIQGKYIYIEFFGRCGWSWPFRENKDPNLKLISWWRGESQEFNILAYGNINNLVGEGKVGFNNVNLNLDLPTWWPSSSESYIHIMNAVAAQCGQNYVRNSEDSNIDDNLRQMYSDLFDGTLNTRNPSVPKGGKKLPEILKKGIYGMLVRIDYVVPPRDINKEIPDKCILFGSPLWVVQKNKIPDGVYEYAVVENQRFGRPIAVADWHRNRWSNPRIIFRSYISERQKDNVVLPPLNYDVVPEVSNWLIGESREMLKRKKFFSKIKRAVLFKS